MPNSIDYRAFLIRLWREPRDDRWRVSLEEPGVPGRTGFASLTALYEYLDQATGQGTMGERDRERSG